MHATAATVLNRLRQVRSNHFQLTESVELKALFRSDGTPPGSATPSRRRFLINDQSSKVVLRVCQTFDITADAYIVDQELGTLGLVYVVQPGEVSGVDPMPATPARIPTWIEQRIGDAAYLRHLLLEYLRPGELQHGCAPYTVEIVFVLATPSLETQVGNTLQEVIREFTILQAIGISLLPFHDALLRRVEPGEKLALTATFQSDLHRAYSWLLHQTREWLHVRLREMSATPDSTTPPPAPPLPSPTPSAIEPPAPPKTVRFRHFSRGQPDQAFDLGRPGPPDEIWLKHFRLGGTRRWQFRAGRMLHLVHGHNGSGKSSFVEAIELITTGTLDRIAKEDHRAVITNRSVQSTPRNSQAEAAASVMLRFNHSNPPKTPSDPPSPPASAAAYPPRTLLAWRLTKAGVTRPLAPERLLKPGTFRLNQDVIDLLSQRGSQERAHRLFETFFPDGSELFAQSRSRVAQRDQALLSLPSRLRASFENATGIYDDSRATSALGWVQGTAIPWDRILVLIPLDSSQIAALLPLLPLAFESQYGRTGTAPSWEPVLEAARAIDEGFSSLLSRATSLSNSTRAAREFLLAYQEGRTVPILQGDRVLAHIGESGALRDLATRAGNVASALQALESARSEFSTPVGGLVGILHQFRALRQIADHQKASKNEEVGQFIERLRTPLGAALNEFTAMVTPARWAYNDIVNRVETAAAKPSLGFVQGDQPATAVPAQLRLNTAQLSAFTLAFFLLCHRAHEHPLRLGILDDPFENMDELTVTTVARGLGRYLRLRTHLGDGPNAWRLILFLHGEQNVERVRREVPCATYLLPWLSPSAQVGKESPITAEASEVFGETLQDLGQIMTDPRSGLAAS